uniref:Uncharacterized protein n=1 Tax=Timema poppense TaxID=170557 RepID=A0A7R9D1K3_TIMPO|nr:unnamed protein product [Timema poppensis]
MIKVSTSWLVGVMMLALRQEDFEIRFEKKAMAYLDTMGDQPVAVLVPRTRENSYSRRETAEPVFSMFYFSRQKAGRRHSLGWGQYSSSRPSPAKPRHVCLHVQFCTPLVKVKPLERLHALFLDTNQGLSLPMSRLTSKFTKI